MTGWGGATRHFRSRPVWESRLARCPVPGPGRRAHRRDLLRGRPPSTSTSCRPSVEAGHVHQGDDDIPAWVQVASGHVAPVWERLWERRRELGANTYRVRVPRASTELDKIFDKALILWCGMVTCGRAESPVLGRDMGALGSCSLQPTEPMGARGVSSAAPKVAW